jgi:hypothetical protein
MAYEIKYKDVNKEDYETLDWVREDVNESLKGMSIINVETLEEDIRFWYKKED